MEAHLPTTTKIIVGALAYLAVGALALWALFRWAVRDAIRRHLGW
jgi:hypothetical protein